MSESWKDNDHGRLIIMVNFFHSPCREQAMKMGEHSLEGIWHVMQTTSNCRNVQPSIRTEASQWLDVIVTEKGLLHFNRNHLHANETIYCK